MRGSLRLFTWFGIPVHLHLTFALIFPILLWRSYGEGWSGFVTETILYIGLFFCVLLHEYGHALTARRYGIHTKDIILTPIGGIARLERLPEKPIQEFIVALAGPLVNVVIAILLFGLLKGIFYGDRWETLDWYIRNLSSSNAGYSNSTLTDELGPTIGLVTPFLVNLLFANIILVVFNLLPAFPMDGGRVLRALLAMRMSRVKATQVAARIGQVVAVGFMAMPVFGGANFLMFGLIGFFVFRMAGEEYRMVKLDDTLRRYKVSSIVRPQFTRLQVSDWMQTPINLLRQGLERNFLVFDMDGLLAGTLDEGNIVAAMRRRDLSTPVSQFTDARFHILRPEDSLQEAWYLLNQRGHSILPVTDGHSLIGVVDDAGMEYFLKLHPEARES